MAERDHPSFFIAGARMSVIWTTAIGFLFNFVIHPALLWVWVITGHPIATAPSAIDGSLLMGMVTAMLGVAGLRSLDKYNKVETTQTKPRLK